MPGILTRGSVAPGYFQTKELAAAACQDAALRAIRTDGRLTEPTDNLACFSLSLVERRKISQWEMVGGSPFGVRVTEVWIWRNDFLSSPLQAWCAE
jgi:hypothetical protein